MDIEERTTFITQLREDATGWAAMAPAKGRDHFAFHGVAHMLNKAADELERNTNRNPKPDATARGGA